MLEKRSTELEIMDDLEISGSVVGQTLKELDIINRRLGGNQISLTAFKKILRENDITSIADLGCGGGDIMIEFAKIAKKKDHDVELIGIDANPHIIQYAEQHTSRYENITFQTENIFDTEFQKKRFDIIHCCLFLHHFTNEELIGLFKDFKHQAKKAIIVNDLHRHWLAYYSIKILTRFFSKSFMVRNDAAVSVARGFKKIELLEILEQADLQNFTLKWKWAFRWQLIIKLN
ncbi:MAG: methyltransferase domain-containing protein [Cyclobacteriaceae bacterium]